MRGLVLGTPVIPVTFSRKVSGGSGRLVRGRPQAGTQGQVASWGGVPGEPGRWEGAGLVHSLGRKKPTRGAAAERPLGGSHTPSAPGPPGTGVVGAALGWTGKAGRALGAVSGRGSGNSSNRLHLIWVLPRPFQLGRKMSLQLFQEILVIYQRRCVMIERV